MIVWCIYTYGNSVNPVGAQWPLFTQGDHPAAVSCVKVEYAYDHQGRMVWKEISRRDAKTQSWEVAKTASLLWDGYNIVQALTHSQTHTLTNHYTWGLDLSGSLQGAGGVGGLLAEAQDGVPYFAAFDANGNVTEYLSADGTLAAHYEYSPFGEIVVQSGDLADSFTHRFSTKPWCPVTGLSEYEFRKYGPGMGRWISRDPVDDAFSHNRYVYCANGGITQIDWNGLYTWEYSGTWSTLQREAVSDTITQLEKQLPERIARLNEVKEQVQSCGEACGDAQLAVILGGIDKVLQSMAKVQAGLVGSDRLKLSAGGWRVKPGTLAAFNGVSDTIYFGTGLKGEGFFSCIEKVGLLYHELTHREVGWTINGKELDSPDYLKYQVLEPWLNADKAQAMFDPGKYTFDRWVQGTLLNYYLNMIPNEGDRKCCEECLKKAIAGAAD